MEKLGCYHFAWLDAIVRGLLAPSFPLGSSLGVEINPSITGGEDLKGGLSGLGTRLVPYFVPPLTSAVSLI